MPDISSPLTATLNVEKIALPAKSETRRFGVLWPRGGVHEPVVKGLISAASIVMQQVSIEPFGSSAIGRVAN
jgi:hypothetical protein